MVLFNVDPLRKNLEHKNYNYFKWHTSQIYLYAHDQENYIYGKPKRISTYIVKFAMFVEFPDWWSGLDLATLLKYMHNDLVFAEFIQANNEPDEASLHLKLLQHKKENIKKCSE